MPHPVPRARRMPWEGGVQGHPPWDSIILALHTGADIQVPRGMNSCSGSSLLPSQMMI